MADKTFHVAFMKPQQQAALRCLCLNLMQLHLKTALDDLMGEATYRNLAYQFRRIMGAHTRFEKSTKHFPFTDEVTTSRGKLFTFDPLAMKNCLAAIKFYEHDNTALSQVDRQLVGEQLESLRKLMGDSSKHEYTKEDIRKMRGGE